MKLIWSSTSAKATLVKHKFSTWAIVDLERQAVVTPAGDEHRFEIDAFRKHCLLNGLDDIGLTLQSADAIRAFEGRWREQSPWLFDVIR